MEGREGKKRREGDISSIPSFVSRSVVAQRRMGTDKCGVDDGYLRGYEWY